MLSSKLVSSILVLAIGGCRYTTSSKIGQHFPINNFAFKRTFSKVSNVKQKVIFVLGGPGSGKGTQCSKLSSEFGFVHLSAGELLRSERKSGSNIGQEIENYLKEGRIVPVEMSLGLIKRELESRKDGEVFLIDGFPR